MVVLFWDDTLPPVETASDRDTLVGVSSLSKALFVPATETVGT